MSAHLAGAYYFMKTNPIIKYVHKVGGILVLFRPLLCNVVNLLLFKKMSGFEPA